MQLGARFGVDGRIQSFDVADGGRGVLLRVDEQLRKAGDVAGLAAGRDADGQVAVVAGPDLLDVTTATEKTGRTRGAPR